MFDEITVPTDFAAVADADLDTLDEQVRAAAQPLLDRHQSGETLTDDELAGLDSLANTVTAVRTERERRVGEAAAQAAGTQAGARAAAAVAAFAAETPPAEPAPTPPQEPPVPAPTVPVETPEGTPPPAEPAEGEAAVTAAARPGVAAVARHSTGNQSATAPAERSSYTRMVAASTAPDVAPGHEFASVEEAAIALEAAMATFSSLGDGQFQKIPVVQLRRDYPDSMRVRPGDSQSDINRKVEDIGRESNLPGGSLVAAAGWCAPSEILYDLFELENGTDGIASLPELQISRGGVQVTPGPDFSTIWAGTGYWHQTEAQVISATSKPCMVISCPTFTDNRLEVEGVCLTGAFLQDRGYPEMVARFTRGAMVAHNRKVNLFVINKLVTGSTLFDYTNVANVPITTTEFKDLTVMSRLLAVLGIQIMDYRYKHRMAFNASLECILPYWVVESVRADVQRRMGFDRDDAFQVAMEQITAWFRVRGANVQFVYDWLDAYNTTNTSTVGQTAGVYTLPTTVEALLYAAGTWVKGVADVIRLDTVYDSTNLALNQYVQLFTEDGVQVIKRGFESRRIKVGIDPSGTSSATVDMRTG